MASCQGQIFSLFPLKLLLCFIEFLALAIEFLALAIEFLALAIEFLALIFCNYLIFKDK